MLLGKEFRKPNLSRMALANDTSIDPCMEAYGVGVRA